ncbi:MAG TPA: hypothetical protein VF713_22470 [Thermoanaerobaculia bacterium]
MATIAAKTALAGKTVTLTANPGAKITAVQVHAALDQIFKMAGCLACGLGGWDLNVHGPRPEVPGWQAAGGFTLTVK